MSSAGENNASSDAAPNGMPSTNQAQKSTDQLAQPNQPLYWLSINDYRSSDYCLEIPLTFLNATAATNSTPTGWVNPQVVAQNQSQMQNLMLLPLNVQSAQGNPVLETSPGFVTENTVVSLAGATSSSSVAQLQFNAQQLQPSSLLNTNLMHPSPPDYTGETQFGTQDPLPSFQSVFIPSLQSVPTLDTENQPNATSLQSCSYSLEPTTSSGISIANNDVNLNDSASDDNKTKNTNDQFACPACGRAFGRDLNLKRHAAGHSVEKKYVCEYCGYKFGRSDNCNNHDKKHLQSEGSNPDGEVEKPRKTRKPKCTCEYCRAEGGNRTKGPNGKPLHICPVEDCASVFEQPKCLLRHLRGHSDEKEFVCDHCDKEFYRRDKLEDHLKSHEGSRRQNEAENDGRIAERPKFACHIAGCEVVFKDVKNLNAHLVSQHGVGPHGCSYCDETFKYKKDLHRHEELAHADEAKFLCSYCKKQCRGEDTLKRHVYLIHENPKYLRNKSERQ